MKTKLQIVLTTIGIVLTSALLVFAAVWGYNMRPVGEQCRTVDYIFEDAHERMYVTTGELNSLLKKEKVYPVGQVLGEGVLAHVESVICGHPMVQKAECYFTPRHEVKVHLTQRVPLLRVQTPGNTYFVDMNRRKMPIRASVKDELLLVTGTVGEQLATGELADFALWLQQEEYWRQKIKYVHMKSPQMMLIYLKGEHQPRIMMGNVRDYERKLRKLHVFMENGIEAVGDKKYYEIDVRFDGQVIGRY